jgi:hypothetical protein
VLGWFNFTATADGGDFLAEIKPASVMPASFGSVDGSGLPGSMDGGSVWISNLARFLFMPTIRK